MTIRKQNVSAHFFLSKTSLRLTVIKNVCMLQICKTLLVYYIRRCCCWSRVQSLDSLPSTACNINLKFSHNVLNYTLRFNCIKSASCWLTYLTTFFNLDDFPYKKFFSCLPNYSTTALPIYMETISNETIFKL